MELTDHEEEGCLSPADGRCRWKPPRCSPRYLRTHQARLLLETAVLAAEREAAAYSKERKETGVPPSIVEEVVVNFGTI